MLGFELKDGALRMFGGATGLEVRRDGRSYSRCRWR